MTNVKLRCLPEDLTFQDTLHLTNMHLPEMDWTYSVRQQITQLLHPLLLEITTGLDSSDALALIRHQLNPDLVSAMV